MRLTEDELKAGWLHPKLLVRNVVAAHFTQALTDDPDVTRRAIDSVQQFGWQRFLTWGFMFADLPLKEEAAFEWVCGQVERTDDGGPEENQKSHLSRMLARAEIDLVERHRSRLLALDTLETDARQAILSRLEMIDLSADEAWRRLEEHCRSATQAETFAEARIPEAELLLEPLARAGNRIVPRVMDVLRSPPAGDNGDTPEEWLTGLVISLAGRLRLEEAAPLLWKLLSIDWDWYEDELITALVRIGTPSVVRLAREHYPSSPWETRIRAHDIVCRIRCDETVAAIPEMLAEETDDFFRSQLGIAAASQFDDRLVPLALDVIKENPCTAECGKIRERLVAFSHLSGWHLAERDEWEQDADAFFDRVSRGFSLTESPFPGIPFSVDDDEFGDDVSGDDVSGDEGAEEGPIRRGAVTGRNEPCPCGSGKKYKRCCLRNEPG